MARKAAQDPKYLIQEPLTGLFVSGSQPAFMVGGAKLGVRQEAAEYTTHADAALAAQDLPRAATPLEIVRVDA